MISKYTKDNNVCLAWFIKHQVTQKVIQSTKLQGVIEIKTKWGNRDKKNCALGMRERGFRGFMDYVAAL